MTEPRSNDEAVTLAHIERRHRLVERQVGSKTHGGPPEYAMLCVTCGRDCDVRPLLAERLRDTAEIERLREALAAERGAVHGVLGHLRATAAERDAERARADQAEAVLGDIYELRERGNRVLDDEQCCELACSSGACESCPCCQAGWCVYGHSVEIPERDLTPQSDYRIWLDTAKAYNPVAELLAHLEGADGVEYDEAIVALAAAGGSTEGDRA